MEDIKYEVEVTEAPNAASVTRRMVGYADRLKELKKNTPDSAIPDRQYL